RHSTHSLYYFFLYHPPHPPHPPSFPTRRSSDLVFPNERFVSAPPFPEFRVIASRNAHPPAGAWDDRGHDVLSLIAKANRKNVTEDRKSTRLNSSHRTISYAVFCLKKKKNNTGLT